MNERIGVFGGSFDPVHTGHKRLADFMIKTLELDRLIVIPTSMSPFKNSGSDSADRLAMCRLVFSGEQYEVSDAEVRRGGTSYTIDTLTELKKQHPEDKMFYIVGSDQLMSFDRWMRWQDILSIVTLVAVARDGEVTTADLNDFADKVLRPAGEILVTEYEPFVISSTQIRGKAAAGEDITPFVGEKVAEYISARGLYSGL